MDIKRPLWIVLFALSWIPVGMLFVANVAHVPDVYPQDFSIYNQDWNGLSTFREDIEGMGYTPVAIQSSMSVATRYEGNAVIVITGPVRDFTTDAIFVIFNHLMNGGSVIIADDFGTANSSFALLNSLISGQLAQSSPIQVQGILSYTGGVLLDLNSYDKSPKLPVITDFRPGLDGGALTQGVSSLHLNWATAINPRSALGLAGVAWTSDRSWCDRNITDPNPYPDDGEWNGSLPVVGALDLSIFGVGGSRGGRIVAISDPSIFTNDMIDRGDNRQFARNVINWATHGELNQTILFCEDLLATPWYAPEFFYGMYLSRVIWLSTLPYIYALYPFVTVVGIRKYLPDMKKPEVKAVSEVFLRRGQTYFSERMTYYRTEGNYARVIKMLYRKLRRDLKTKHLWAEYDPQKVWDLMKDRDPALKRSDFFKTISRIEKISANPSMKIRENEMMDLFFFMRNIQNKLIDTKM